MEPPPDALPLTALVARLLGARASVDALLLAFWASHRAAVADVPSPLDRAVLGGAAADRLGWAFVAGYQAALCALVPSRDAAQLGAFCATEAGGAHPRAILSELGRAASGGLVLRGHKRWSTTVPHVEVLYVVAREGVDADARPRLRVVALDALRTGVRFEPMPSPPFIPEVPHGEVLLEDVAVAEREVLPGDGYARYVKPFRTVEDLHVNAALLGYLLGAARRHAAPPALVERLLVALVAARALATEALDAAAAHVALAGLLETARALAADVTAHLRARPTEAARTEHARLVRDLPLLGVAARAREARTATAWAVLAKDAPPEGSSGGTLA
jgi:alkylation response protein AidB-like acyl-CoA dehydrogenase